jgi:multiple sugar transport system ATP-binding protein
MSSVSLKHIFKTYAGGVLAVNDLSLEIQDKEFLVLVGPSGCGKTTTLRIVAGLEDLTGGDLLIDNENVNHVPAKHRNLAMVFQNFALYPHMTAYENMAFSLNIRRMPKPEIKKRILGAASLLGIEEILGRRPGELSGGQMQRVALGRAIVRDPKVFLMDEPLSNLDAKLRAQMRAEIIRLHKSLGTTFIYVTHDQTEAMTMGTRIAVMNKGVLQQVDTPANLYDRPANQFVAGFIGTPQMNFFPVRLNASQEGVEIILGGYPLRADKKTCEKILSNGYKGREAILGVRPEDIHLEENFVAANPQSTLNATVEMSEMTGAETFVHLSISGAAAVARAARFSAPAGTRLKAALNTENIHLFDPETQESILYGPGRQK